MNHNPGVPWERTEDESSNQSQLTRGWVLKARFAHAVHTCLVTSTPPVPQIDPSVFLQHLEGRAVGGYSP